MTITLQGVEPYEQSLPSQAKSKFYVGWVEVRNPTSPILFWVILYVQVTPMYGEIANESG